MKRSGIWRSFPVEVEKGKVIYLDLAASKGNMVGPKGGNVEDLFFPCIECGRLCNPFEFLIRLIKGDMCYLEGIETGPDARKCYRHFPDPAPIPYYQMNKLMLRIRKLRDASGSLIGFWSLPTKGITKWRKVAQHKTGIRMIKYKEGPKNGQCKIMALQPRVDRGHSREGVRYESKRKNKKSEETPTLADFLDTLFG